MIKPQLVDPYKCARCGTEKTLRRSGTDDPHGPLLYCMKCGCIRLHELIATGSETVPVAVAGPAK